MPFSTAGCNLMLNAIKGTNPTAPITHASLHNNDPGDNGANELTGGSPAYARKAVTFDAAASKQMIQNGTDPVFDIPAGTTVKYVGFWSAISGGTFLGSAAVTNEVYAAQGTYQLDTSTLSLA